MFIGRLIKLYFYLKVCDMLACHNYWHWALYHMEKVKIQQKRQTHCIYNI